MKKILFFALALIAFAMGSCDEKNELAKTIKFQTGTEQKIPVQSVKVGDRAQEPKLELKKGDSILDYWMLNGQKFDFSKPITQGVTLVPKWKLNLSMFKIVRFNTLTPTVLDSQLVKIGGNAKAPDVTGVLNGDSVIAHWMLAGNKFEFEKVVINQDIELTAKWKYDPEKIKTVSFVTGTEQTISPIKTQTGGKITAPSEALTRTGYLFKAWTLENKVFDFSKTISNDITLTAKWAKLLELKFEGQHLNMQDTVWEINTLLNLNAPVRAGYKLTNWQVNGQDIDLSTFKITENTTLSAVWQQVVTHKITFVSKSYSRGHRGYLVKSLGELQANENSPIPADLGFEAPTKNGYDLVWKRVALDANVAQSDSRIQFIDFDFQNDKVVEPMKFVAIFTLKKYTVKFVTGNGSVLPDQQVEHGKGVQSSDLPTDLQKEGYLFKGWFNGESPYRPGNWYGKLYGPTTLTVKWAKAVTISYVTGTNETIDDKIVGVGDKLIPPTLSQTVSGKVFGGWKANGQEFNFGTQTARQNITLEAIWEDPSAPIRYATIDKASYDLWDRGEMRLVKAKLEYRGDGASWGSEVYVTDYKGNDTKDKGYLNGYAAFSHPVGAKDKGATFKSKFYENGEPKTFVFKIFKDTYMSTPQFGFGGKKSTSYYKWKWQTPYVYGIEYFDEVHRGIAKAVVYENGVGVKLTLKTNIDIIFPELKQADVSRFDNFYNKIIYINSIKVGDKWHSKLDHTKQIQVSSTLGGTGNPYPAKQ